MTKQLEAEVARVIATAHGMPGHLNDDGVNLLLPVREVCGEIVRRLLAGGISETAIRNTLVHHRPASPQRDNPFKS